MARIRTVKPDFWEDAKIGRLSRSARLLFIALFNFADDEGILRWSAPVLQSKAFTYDEDLTLADVRVLMKEITDAGLVFVYNPGNDAEQPMGLIVKFRQHQVINRANPTRMHVPSLRDPAVQHMYGQRENWTCLSCSTVVYEGEHTFELLKVPTDKKPNQKLESPSNIALVHRKCLRAGREAPSMTMAHAEDTLFDSPETGGDIIPFSARKTS